MNEPKLEKPGAGLPLFERLAAKYFLVPYYSRKTPWDDSAARFEKEGRKILERLKPLSREERKTRVLIERIQGIEDSSRFWSVAMAIEHLMIVGEAGLGGIVLLSRGETPPFEARVEAVKPKGELDVQTLEARFEAFLSSYQNRLKTDVRDRASKTTFAHPWFGPMTAAQWHWLMASHQHIHRKQIDRIIASLKKTT